MPCRPTALSRVARQRKIAVYRREPLQQDISPKNCNRYWNSSEHFRHNLSNQLVRKNHAFLLANQIDSQADQHNLINTRLLCLLAKVRGWESFSGIHNKNEVLRKGCSHLCVYLCSTSFLQLQVHMNYPRWPSICFCQLGNTARSRCSTHSHGTGPVR